MFKPGDLINYIGQIEKYKGKPFTVLGDNSYIYNSVSCRRGNMVHSKVFNVQDVELIESEPKHPIGDPVEIKSLGNHNSVIGVIVGSNQVASIIRVANYTHSVHFVPNSKIRKIK